MSRRVFRLYVLLAATVITAISIGLRRLLAGLPSFQALEEYTPSLTTRVYDIHNEEIAELSIEKRALLTLSEIPVDLQNAVIATEDNDFFHHWGISPKGMMRAMLRNLIYGRIAQGGSTLTQQLSKVIFLSPERKYIRKIKEVLLALQLEHNFSKEEILQLYLNQIYFGHGAYGVQAAAKIYFGKDVSELTLAECALLAGQIKYPGGYSPFVYPARARLRRAVVLGRMLEEHYITKEEEQKALDEPIPTQRPALKGIQAPYFVEYIRRQLEPKYGYNTLWRGGLKIYTTLDMKAQHTAEEMMEKALSGYDDTSKKDWQKKLEEQQKEQAAEEEAGMEPLAVSTTAPSAIQGAFVLIDVKTGAIRAMIGGRGESQYNRATQAHRQPGSTFKPFVWAAALQSGLTGASLVDDSPLAYYYDGKDWRLLQGATDQFALDQASATFTDSEDFKVWVPNDFDGKFLGVITLRKALALSRNVASVRLIEHVGPPQVVSLAHKAGIQSNLDPVLALGLGASVVSPLELANAFGTFSNAGIHVEPFSVIRVENNAGRELERHIPKESEAMSPQLAYLITHLMKGVVEHGTAMNARRLNRPLAGKTGTTNDNRDLWFVGFTPDLVAAAWMGYDDFQSLGRKDWTGGSTVVPWWTNIMSQVLKDYPSRDFPVPDGITFAKIDADTGMLALPTCPHTALQAFRKGTEPVEYCNVDHSKPFGLAPSFRNPGDLSTPVGSEFQPLAPATTDQMLTPPSPAEEPADSNQEPDAVILQ